MTLNFNKKIICTWLRL